MEHVLEELESLERENRALRERVDDVRLDLRIVEAYHSDTRQYYRLMRQRDAKERKPMSSFEIDLDVHCADCGTSLPATCEMNRYGSVVVAVEVCEKCIQKAVDDAT
jgi:hypothetical protein